MLTIHCADSSKTRYFIPENDNKKPTSRIWALIEALAFIVLLGFVGAIIK